MIYNPYGIPECQHHWVVETPTSTLIEGRCKKCGETKQFPTVPVSTRWKPKTNMGES